MTARDDANETGDDQPVQVQDVLDLPDDGKTATAPSGPSDQPSLPDFNS